MRKLITSIFLLGGLILTTPAVSAHVEISATFPEQFTNATPIPMQVWIDFSGPLQTLDGETLNTIEVVDSTGIAVSFDDPVIEGSKITTKVSGQSAPGVFIVKYRVVGEDGHIIDGEYTFNASPDYSATPAANNVNSEQSDSKNYVGLIGFGALATTLLAGYIIKTKKDVSK